jgi:hypothetical protein
MGALLCNTFRDPAPRRVAKRNRLGQHYPDLRRCLSGKRSTVAEPDAATEPPERYLIKLIWMDTGLRNFRDTKR